MESASLIKEYMVKSLPKNDVSFQGYNTVLAAHEEKVFQRPSIGFECEMRSLLFKPMDTEPKGEVVLEGKKLLFKTNKNSFELHPDEGVLSIVSDNEVIIGAENKATHPEIVTKPYVCSHEHLKPLFHRIHKTLTTINKHAGTDASAYNNLHPHLEKLHFKVSTENEGSLKKVLLEGSTKAGYACQATYVLPVKKFEHILDSYEKQDDKERVIHEYLGISKPVYMVQCDIKMGKDSVEEAIHYKEETKPKEVKGLKYMKYIACTPTHTHCGNVYEVCIQYHYKSECVFAEFLKCMFIDQAGFTFINKDDDYKINNAADIIDNFGMKNTPVILKSLVLETLPFFNLAIQENVVEFIRTVTDHIKDQGGIENFVSHGKKEGMLEKAEKELGDRFSLLKKKGYGEEIAHKFHDLKDKVEQLGDVPFMFYRDDTLRFGPMRSEGGDDLLLGLELRNDKSHYVLKELLKYLKEPSEENVEDLLKGTHGFCAQLGFETVIEKFQEISAQSHKLNYNSGSKTHHVNPSLRGGSHEEDSFIGEEETITLTGLGTDEGDTELVA